MPTGAPLPLPGFEPAGSASARTWGIAQGDRAKALVSWQALRRRIALGAGPTADRWSSYPAEGLTPEMIVQCRKEAHAGYPWRWADLVEQIIERNYAVKSFLHFRRAWSYAVPHRVDPPEHFTGDDLAQDLCRFEMAVINGLRGCWKDVVYNLLSASAYGYAAAEVFWDYRTITFKRHSGDEVSIPDCWVPVHMQFVHQKHFMFQIYSGDPLIWMGQGAPGAQWPMGKIIFNRAVGDGITERRGFMTAGAWVEYAMQHGWQDLLIWMRMYGLPQFALMIEKEIIEQEEAWAIIQEGVTNYGNAQIPIWLKNDAEVAPLGQVTGEPVHPEIIKMGEQMLSLLIVGSVLAQTQGDGTGSYNAGSEHAVTAHVYRLPDGGGLETSFEEQLLKPTVHFNVDVLARALRKGPEQIRQRNGLLFGWKAIDKAPTVSEVIGHYQTLTSLGFPCSKSEISQRTGYAQGEGEDRLGLAAMGEGGGGLQLTPTQQGAIASVDEARASVGLEPDPENGSMKVSQLIAQQAPVVAAAAAAEEGQHGASKPGEGPVTMEYSADARDPGVMIALYPLADLAEQLAVQGGEPAAELHITLAYLGRLSAIGDLNKVTAALQKVWLGARLTGHLGGIGIFPPSESSEGRAVVWVPVDVPGLAELRQAIVQELDGVGLAPKANHGWTPHLTLAYVEPGGPTPQPVKPAAVTFGEIWLVCGEQRQRFPLDAQETIR